MGGPTEPPPAVGDKRPPLPRKPRKPHRSRADRGLPPDDELAKLASAFLQRQRKHWPQLAEAGLFPEPTPAVISGMVADFKICHRTGNVDIDSVRRFSKFCSKLAGNYNRYSCDNSSPLSVLDQMVNSLDKARAEARLIPWEYVFADYSVTGLDATRQGYSSYKKVLEHGEQLIETTYIDDFSRASRDALEWWKLAALSKRLNKRMIGASDGFDLSSADWDIKITIYGLLSRLFIKQLREKVRRGMKGAARRGTCLGKLSLGFTRRVHCKPDGEAVLDPDGQPIYEPCIDPVSSEDRLAMYVMFVERGMSAYQIARDFNRRKVDGWNRWTEGGIKGLLFSPDAIGVSIWNRNRSEYDYEAEKYITVRNPRSEWQVRYAPELAIVPLHLWRATRRKLAEMRRSSPLTGKKLSRNTISATTTFSGTLFCDYCVSELKLNRSTSKYKVMGCLNGLIHACDCQLSTSKSVSIIEDCLLGFLRNHLLTEAHLEELVSRANQHLAIEALKPLVDTKPWKAEQRRLQAKIKKLVSFIENEENPQLCRAHHERAKELQREVIVLQSKIREAEGLTPKQPQPLSMSKAREYLDQLRKTLNGDIPVAAEAIRAVTGPIRIRQDTVAGRRGARWIAKFRPDLLRGLRMLAERGSNSRSMPSEHADQEEAVEVMIDKVPKYEILAPKLKALRERGASIKTIAAAHGLTADYATTILKFAQTGQRPERKPSKGGGMDKWPEKKFVAVAPLVAALRDEQRMPFKQIARKLHVGEATARRAYDHIRPEAARAAAESGTRPKRGSYFIIGNERFRQICELLPTGQPVTEIARKAGCSVNTVYRVKQQLEKDKKLSEAG